MEQAKWKWGALAGAGAAAVLLVWLAANWLLPPGENVVRKASATLLRLERQQQLITTRAFVQAVVRQRSEQWYGSAEVIRIVPGTVSYAVDLAAIDRDKLEYVEEAPGRRVLHVPLPDVKVVAVDPDLARAETIRSLDLMRTQGGAGNELEAATEKMVRPALEQAGNSTQALSVAREQAIASIKYLLESVLNATGAAVEVKPYFKSEGLQ